MILKAYELVDKVQPVVVNFAAQGMVAESWLQPTIGIAPMWFHR